MKHTSVLFVVICSILAVSPFAAYGLAFTLSNDAIMALDYNDRDFYYPYINEAPILAITDVNGSGVQFDILFPDPHNYSGQYPPLLERTSSVRGGNGVLAGRDISMFDAFALKFTLLSARGVSTSDAVGSLVVGSMINEAVYSLAFNPEYIAINNSYPPASATSLTTTNANQISTVGFNCYIPYRDYDESYPNPWDPCGAIVSILVEPAPDAVVMTSNPNQVFQLVSINKCTVAAGGKYNDKISFSGKMNPVYDNLYLTNFIQIAIGSDDMADPCVIMIPTNNTHANYKKTGKFSYSGTDENGAKKSFKLDFKTHKFSFAAQNVNLSGLSCPLKVRVDIAGFDANTNVDETIVNGKKLIPINLLMGVKDSLRVDKIKVKYGSKMNSDQLTVSGGFSVASVETTEANLVDSVFDVNLASQSFSIPAKSFKGKNGKFTCSNAKLDGGIGIAAATFDFNKCTFAITIKNTSVDYPGDTSQFAVQCADFNANTEAEITY
ncbi:MAG: hypothetical protein ABSF37_00230 [Sedimentisphaerales bacterium]